MENGNVIVNGSPEYVRSCCEGSLQRLGVSYIDLYYQHRVDTTVPIEDTVSAAINYFSFSCEDYLFGGSVFDMFVRFSLNDRWESLKGWSKREK